MSTMASHITGVSIICSAVYQSSVSLAFVRGIHRWPVTSPHKGPVTRKMFTFDEVIMIILNLGITFQMMNIIFNKDAPCFSPKDDAQQIFSCWMWL